MAEFKTTHPLDDFFSKLGKQNKSKELCVKVLTNFDMVQVFSVDGKVKAVEKALGIKQSPGMASVTKDYRAIPVSPAQWLIVSSRQGVKDFAGSIKTKLKRNGYISQQSDARVIFSLSGSKAKELMQKGCRLDLHPSATPSNWCAQTVMAQVGTILHKVDDAPTFDVFVYSGYAEDFAQWLLHTGLQLGVTFEKE